MEASMSLVLFAAGLKPSSKQRWSVSDANPSQKPSRGSLLSTFVIDTKANDISPRGRIQQLKVISDINVHYRFKFELRQATGTRASVDVDDGAATRNICSKNIVFHVALIFLLSTFSIFIFHSWVKFIFSRQTNAFCMWQRREMSDLRLCCERTNIVELRNEIFKNSSLVH